MIFQHLQSGLPISDSDFDRMYAARLRKLSSIYFTPIEVAKIAAQFLVHQPGTKVLDIGSGAGKFCMIGSACTEGYFTGVEFRESLFALSQKLAEQHGFSNLHFILSNITEVDFSAFDAVYFFNSFYENIAPTNPIDHTTKLDKSLYIEYSLYVRDQLEAMPIGTRLATYFSYLIEIPSSYQAQATYFDGKLRLWKKTT